MYLGFVLEATITFLDAFYKIVYPFFIIFYGLNKVFHTFSSIYTLQVELIRAQFILKVSLLPSNVL